MTNEISIKDLGDIILFEETRQDGKDHLATFAKNNIDFVIDSGKEEIIIISDKESIAFSYKSVVLPVSASLSDLKTALTNMLLSWIPSTPKVYKAILTQSGTNAPDAKVLNSSDANYLGDLTWYRDNVGRYYASKIGISSKNTLVSICGIRTADTETVYSGNAQTNTVIINQFVAGSYIDGILYMAVTIEYYGS